MIVESTSRSVLDLYREAGESQWRAEARGVTETVALPELGIEIPVSELYEGVDLEAAEGLRDA